VLGEQAAGERADADREQEGSLVDGDGARPPRRRADIGQYHLPRGEDEACAGDEARSDEFQIAARPSAPQIAERREEAAEGQGRSPADPIG